jgi:saccharopine dehydrogenase (NAD+, L-lysine-forming)
MDAGIQVTLEASEVSAYKPSEYPSGVTLVSPGSWVSEAPKDAFIYGLKELPESTEPLAHRHIMFGHCFKGQDGWAEMLKRFDDGKGTLFDLEFLQDENGMIVSASVSYGI